MAEWRRANGIAGDLPAPVKKIDLAQPRPDYRAMRELPYVDQVAAAILEGEALKEDASK